MRVIPWEIVVLRTHMHEYPGEKVHGVSREAGPIKEAKRVEAAVGCEHWIGWPRGLHFPSHAFSGSYAPVAFRLRFARAHPPVVARVRHRHQPRGVHSPIQASDGRGGLPLGKGPPTSERLCGNGRREGVGGKGRKEEGRGKEERGGVASRQRTRSLRPSGGH